MDNILSHHLCAEFFETQQECDLRAVLTDIADHAIDEQSAQFGLALESTFTPRGNPRCGC